MPKIVRASQVGKPAEKKSAKFVGGLEFQKSKGQHILKNPLVVDSIITMSKLRSSDIVLEIGPGTGNLTQKLLPIVKKVVAIELDPRMVNELQKRFRDHECQSKLHIILGDILKVDLPYFDICVANVPYNISSAIIFRLLSHRPIARNFVLMFQREFAQRVCARPGDSLYCRLSVNCQLMAKCRHLIKVSKNSFRPPPKVDSSVISICPKQPLPDVNFVEWDGFMRILFSRKNKTIRASFSPKSVLELLTKNYETYCALNNLPVPIDINMRQMVDDILAATDYGDKRAAKCDIPDFAALLAAFNQHNIHFIA